MNMQACPLRLILPLLVSALTLALGGGCFSERSFPKLAGDLRPLPILASDAQAPMHARRWLRYAHQRLRPLLPAHERAALLSADLVDTDQAPRNVYATMDEERAGIHTVFSNYHGVLHSAQATGADINVEQPAPQWPGCQWVWIPIGQEFELAGQLGLARRDGHVLDSDCIIILPGFFGDTGPKRSADLAQALLRAGFHVLGLEQRGCGQTERRFPHVPYTFGVLETGDLLAVAAWLEAQPHIRRTGMMGFCWGANQVLLAAWEEALPPDEPSIDPRLRRLQTTTDGQRHFEAGMLAFSPTLRFEDFADACEFPRSVWNNAILDRFQTEVENRQARRGYPVNGSLRRLVISEYQRLPGAYENMVLDGYDYLRFLPYRGHSAGDKLERVRVPTLIIHAINDPMANAQDVADLMATVENPNVAAIMLPGGGHLGFAPFAREYFYSLVLNFFDAQRGPVAVTPPAAALEESTDAAAARKAGAKLRPSKADGGPSTPNKSSSVGVRSTTLP